MSCKLPYALLMFVGIKDGARNDPVAIVPGTVSNLTAAVTAEMSYSQSLGMHVGRQFIQA